MSAIIIEPQLLPPIEYFCAIFKAGGIHLDIHHHYEKQTYRNRCLIRGANKVERLTVPVISSNRTPYLEVQINYEPDWVNTFWRSVTSAYANAPFFLYYAQDFEKIFFSKPNYLHELTIPLLTLCLKLLKMDVNMTFSEKYEKKTPEGIKDLRSHISPKQSFLDRGLYDPVPYLQLFGANFEANLSVIDLIFCEGPNSLSIVTKSAR